MYFLFPLKRPTSKDTLVLIAVSTLGTQILVSNAILQKKEPGILGEMADAMAGAG